MTIAGRTAEWICTNCGSTNRKLVPFDTETVTDRCVSCKMRHDVTVSGRPVRWDARRSA